MKTKRRGKKIVKALLHGRDMLLTHDELKKREEEELDRNETAGRERRLEDIQRDEDAAEEIKANIKLLNKLHIQSTTPKHAANGTAKEAIEEIPEAEDVIVGRASDCLWRGRRNDRRRRRVHDARTVRFAEERCGFWPGQQLFDTVLGWRMIDPKMPPQHTVSLGETAETSRESMASRAKSKTVLRSNRR